MATLKTYIVEDSAVIRENLIATLEELAAVEVVGHAEDEATALKWLRGPSNACHLGIIDIFLKQGSGLGVLQAMRHSGQATKLVVLSNFATPEVRRKCLALGADRVFDKSHEIDALVRYCERLASGSDVNESAAGGLDVVP